MLTDTNDPNFAADPRGFPLVMVPDLAAVRTFYVETLGCEPTFDLPQYLQVQLTPLGNRGPELCFMVDESADGARGVLLSVPVADADQVQTQLADAGVAIAEPATDRPWGWRSLHVIDPAGLVLDLYHVLRKAPDGE